MFIFAHVSPQERVGWGGSRQMYVVSSLVFPLCGLQSNQIGLNLMIITLCRFCLKKGVCVCVYAPHVSVPYGCKMSSFMLKCAEVFKHKVRV